MAFQAAAASSRCEADAWAGTVWADSSVTTISATPGTYTYSHEELAQALEDVAAEVNRKLVA